MRAWSPGGAPPVEHRLLGLDRRYIWPTLGVVLLVIFWTVIVPGIDEAMTADEIPNGTVYTLAREVEFTPAPGWTLNGVASPAAPAIGIYRDGITFDIQSGAFNGTSDALLTEIKKTSKDFKVEGDTFPLSLSNSAATGSGIQIFGTDFSGYLYALVGPGTGDNRETGVQVVVKGPPNILPQHQDEIDQMIGSIRFASGSGR
jgi:hypothetical protein